MAHKLHITTNYLWMIEAGRRFPSLELSIALATLSGANPRWIRSLWINEAAAIKQITLNNKSIDEGEEL